MSIKCVQCGLVNAGENVSCRRCNAVLSGYTNQIPVQNQSGQQPLVQPMPPQTQPIYQQHPQQQQYSQQQQYPQQQYGIAPQPIPGQQAPCPRCAGVMIYRSESSSESTTGTVLVVVSIFLIPFLIGIVLLFIGAQMAKKKNNYWHCCNCGTMFPG